MLSSYQLSLLVKLVTVFLSLLPKGNSLVFNYTSFQQSNVIDIWLEKDAEQGDGALQLTRNRQDGSIGNSYGRASYNKSVKLWDPNTKVLTDFTTHFWFVIDGQKTGDTGDGLTFFIAPFESKIPDRSYGGSLGLFRPDLLFNSSSSSPIVAVEFDTFPNPFDPSPKSSDPGYNLYHVGIDINSIVSVKNVTLSISRFGRYLEANASVSYNSASKNLSVFLTYAGYNQTIRYNSSLSHIVDLRKILQEEVRVGFSAATGASVQIQKIKSWLFNSTLESITSSTNHTDSNLGAPNPSLDTSKERGKGRERLWTGLAVCFGLLLCGLGVVWFMFWRRRVLGSEKEMEEEDYDVSIDVEFERGAGPKRFTYRELSQATNNFSEEGKLGEGGFGGVYKGLLRESNTEVAVKRVSKGSRQGKKEYISEVKIISRLRHRNLVQLIGWCHRQDEFLLVYEYLPNGSLDSHLFGGKFILPWVVRRKIAFGLASSLLYLHEEWEQCVVHRDIKSSNVMLDSNFNTKLGDFGLARLVDHDMGLDTTVIAGTRGYMAPECVMSIANASKESDVYSFGVVALEISCGRRPIVLNAEEPSKVMLVEWVWEFYGKGQLQEAVDKGLSIEFDERAQIECLMVVGLWCCHPDPTSRPSIKQVMSVLDFEAPLPKLPPKLPVPMYVVPTPLNVSLDSYSSSVVTGSSIASSSSVSTTKPMLKFENH